MVYQIKDPETGKDIFVIGRENLQSFAQRRDRHPMAGTRFYNTLVRGPYWESKVGEAPAWEEMFTHDEDQNFVLKAEYAHLLLDSLLKDRIRFERTAKRQVAFFADFCDELYLKDPPKLSD